jgi:hypothetical protein
MNYVIAFICGVVILPAVLAALFVLAWLAERAGIQPPSIISPVGLAFMAGMACSMAVLMILVERITKA